MRIHCKTRPSSPIRATSASWCSAARSLKTWREAPMLPSPRGGGRALASAADRLFGARLVGDAKSSPRLRLHPLVSDRIPAGLPDAVAALIEPAKRKFDIRQLALDNGQRGQIPFALKGFAAQLAGVLVNLRKFCRPDRVRFVPSKTVSQFPSMGTLFLQASAGKLQVHNGRDDIAKHDILDSI